MSCGRFALALPQPCSARSGAACEGLGLVLARRCAKRSRVMVSSPIRNDVMPHAHVKPARHVIARQARRKLV